MSVKGSKVVGIESLERNAVPDIDERHPSKPVQQCQRVKSVIGDDARGPTHSRHIPRTEGTEDIDMLGLQSPQVVGIHRQEPDVELGVARSIEVVVQSLQIAVELVAVQDDGAAMSGESEPCEDAPDHVAGEDKEVDPVPRVPPIDLHGRSLLKSDPTCENSHARTMVTSAGPDGRGGT